MSHVHAKIVPTPDSRPDSKDLFADKINYMDKLVGKLINSLDILKLRERTLIVFFGDNGTSNPWCLNSTVNGKKLSGKKGEMKECGSLVPMIANWPGIIKPNSINNQLIDASDFVSTFTELTGGIIPKEKVIDTSLSDIGINDDTPNPINREHVEQNNEINILNHIIVMSNND